MNTLQTPTTQSERIGSLDFLRGIAVLGILVINIESFSYPTPFNPYRFGFEQELDTQVRFWIYFFFQGKFFGIFTLLFGVGFYLFLERLDKKGLGLGALDLYARRLLWLFVIGVIHGYLLWPGDVLYHYATCGLLLFPFRSMSVKRLLIILIIPVSAILYNSYVRTSKVKDQYLAYETAKAINERDRSDQDLKSIKSWERKSIKKGASTYEKTVEIRRGSYIDNLIENANHTKVHKGTIMYQGILFRTLIMMILGIILYKLGVFLNYKVLNHYWLITGVLLIFALILNYYRYQHWTYEYFDPVKNIWVGWLFSFPKEILGLAYVLVLNGVYQVFSKKYKTKIISSAGKMALTNYLMQTVICVFIFYGYGFGKYNIYSRSELLTIVVGIWIFQLAFSFIWLKKYEYGPMEWLWRRLTYGR